MLYKPAKIFDAGGDTSKAWYIHYLFRMDTASTFKRFRVTGDINRIAAAPKRKAAAETLAMLINLALENGYNPYEQDVGEAYAATGLCEAITGIIEARSKGLRKKSGGTFRTHTNKFFAWLKSKGMDGMELAQFTPVMAQRYHDYLVSKKYSPVTVNRNIDTLRNCFTRLHKMKVIADNPWTVVDKLREPESEMYELFTDAELQTIFTVLGRERPQLRLYGFFIYYCFMRPASINPMKAGQIDFEKRTVTVPPLDHKNAKATVKQLLEPMYDELIAAGVDKLPKDWHVFGHGLLPGVPQCKKDRYNKDWKRYVMKGMGIQKKIYALKHTGGCNYIRDNPGRQNLAWLQKQMGHSSLAETQAYLAKMGMVFLDEGNSTIRKF